MEGPLQACKAAEEELAGVFITHLGEPGLQDEMGRGHRPRAWLRALRRHLLLPLTWPHVLGRLVPRLSPDPVFPASA